MIAAVLGVAVWASFVTYWPYNLSLSFKNYNFAEFEPNGVGDRNGFTPLNVS